MLATGVLSDILVKLKQMIFKGINGGTYFIPSEEIEWNSL
jgi:hypothetical protein